MYTDSWRLDSRWKTLPYETSPAGTCINRKPFFFSFLCFCLFWKQCTNEFVLKLHYLTLSKTRTMSLWNYEIIKADLFCPDTQTTLFHHLSVNCSIFFCNCSTGHWGYIYIEVRWSRNPELSRSSKFQISKVTTNYIWIVKDLSIQVMCTLLIT